MTRTVQQQSVIVRCSGGGIDIKIVKGTVKEVFQAGCAKDIDFARRAASNAAAPALDHLSPVPHRGGARSAGRRSASGLSGGCFQPPMTCQQARLSTELPITVLVAV